MEQTVTATDSEKQFIEFLIGYIVQTDPGDLLTNISKVSTHIQKEYDPKHELNLFRKQFGNLKDCVKQPAIQAVFCLEGTSFRFVHPTKVQAAKDAGILTETAWATFQQ